MFRRKKPVTEPGQVALRGRETSPRDPDGASRPAANPLARRLQRDAEPSTVDLAGPPAFPDTTRGTDPQTATLQATSARLERFISHDPQTGKLYVHPGDGQTSVTLGGNAVSAPTELRPGDEVRIGGAVFRFLPSA